MSEMENSSMDPLISSLLHSFKQVPLSAIPPLLDCILASTALSPSSLYASLIHAFPLLIKDVFKEDHVLEFGNSHYIASTVGALCHLLKESGGTNPDGIHSFIWKCFIPLMKTVHSFEREMLSQIAESFFSVVSTTNSWSVLEATLVPFFLRSVGLSMGMLQNEEADVFNWVCQGSNDLMNGFVLDEETITSLSIPFPLPVSCHILASTLDASLQNYEAASTLGSECCYVQKLFTKLLWDLCNTSERLLSHSSEHRSCTVGFLLPILFKSFASHHSLEIMVRGSAHILSRNLFFRKIWKCCCSMFSLGALERRDAYSILSLYLSFFTYSEGCEYSDSSSSKDEFDVRAEKKFWDEIKTGLVDEEGLVRKQSLHILKTALRISETKVSNSGVSERKSQGKQSVPHGMTKREVWADEEAKSLGVGKLCNSVDSPLNGRQQWEAFLLLYEMLEEYGTHLVEAAWNHQMTLLLQFSISYDSFASYISRGVHQTEIDTLGETFHWLAILWQLGFRHDNPHVRCMIMQSFLDIEWRKYGDSAKLVPESFILGSFINGLNDPVHHKDFGVKGVYTSNIIEGAAQFLHQYSSYLNIRKGIAFLHSLASLAKHQSFGRAGLMGLSECIASAARGVGTCNKNGREWQNGAFPHETKVEYSQEKSTHIDKTALLDVLRFVIESSKQHFNPNYRLQVCEKILDATASLVGTTDVPLEALLLFISILPQEFTDYGGSLRVRTQQWLLGSDINHCSANTCSDEIPLLRSLLDFPERFTSSQDLVDAFVIFDDEDLDAWESEVKRWARVLFFVVKSENELAPILKFIQNCGVNICKQCNCLEWLPVKFLILIRNLVLELQIMQERAVGCGTGTRCKGESSSCQTVDLLPEASIISGKFSGVFLSILEELACFANISCSIFWSDNVIDTNLPGSIRGKLGGPSQRRLPSSTTAAVLQAITSMQAVASILSWCRCVQFTSDIQLKPVLSVLWKFFWKTVSSKAYDSETVAEIRLAAYEALTPVLQALAFTFSPLSLRLIGENDDEGEVKRWLDSMILSFLQNVNDLLAIGVLARARRAILLNWKWCCLESLLSIPHLASGNGLNLEASNFSFSDAAIRHIFCDIVESLENAGEGSVLPMLRSVRLALDLFASGKSGFLVSSCDGVDDQDSQRINKQMIANFLRISIINQIKDNTFSGNHCPRNSLVKLNFGRVTSRELKATLVVMCGAVPLNVFSTPIQMWRLVHSSWILHVNSKKRRVASIAALFSSVLHMSVFADERMHLSNSVPGPLKWFIEHVLDEGRKSPRTIRLAALHLTGLWLSYPRTIKYYIKELKLLTLYGSVAFDEDFEAELTENKDASIEVSLLAKSPDSELAEAFVNTELYARVSVAVLFCKLADLADLVGSIEENEDCQAALESGQLLLLALLDSVVNDKDLAKELYKKYSGIHRRKIRAWQMICVMSRFVTQEIVGQVTCSLHIALYRNNLPAVRQYLETFAINIYLKFPSLVVEQLVPILRDYDMRPQALSSYVFIAANVLLHASKANQSRHLDDLLPPIVPLLTSHHHSLRGFTQLLVYQVLCKYFPLLELGDSESTPLEKKCLKDLKLYLTKNPDCRRLRASMEGYLDAYDPIISCIPAGIFVNRVEELEFECVPTSLMEEVLNFLNDVREDLRSSMAKDAGTIKKESFKIGEELSYRNDSQLPSEIPLDFQKKITLAKHEKEDHNSCSLSGRNEVYEQLLEMEKEDELLVRSLQCRTLFRERVRASRQQLILVASLLDRIPNLAGLARTCEVFKASGLTISDKSVLHDKQFQLISVTAEKWVPIMEVPVDSVKHFLEKKKREGYSILGLEQTANSVPLDQYSFPKKTVLVLGREKEGIPVDIIHVLDACIEIPQLGVVRSLNVHVSGAIALWEYTRQQRS